MVVTAAARELRVVPKLVVAPPMVRLGAQRELVQRNVRMSPASKRRAHGTMGPAFSSWIVSGRGC